MEVDDGPLALAEHLVGQCRPPSSTKLAADAAWCPNVSTAAGSGVPRPGSARGVHRPESGHAASPRQFDALRARRSGPRRTPWKAVTVANPAPTSAASSVGSSPACRRARDGGAPGRARRCPAEGPHQGPGAVRRCRTAPTDRRRRRSSIERQRGHVQVEHVPGAPCSDRRDDRDPTAVAVSRRWGSGTERIETGQPPGDRAGRPSARRRRCPSGARTARR